MCVDYEAYIKLLKEELIPSMGCTEPIALALAGAKGRELLEELPEKVIVKASGSIIKNTKSVVVPNTNQMRGIPVAVAAGIVAGDAKLKLQVLSQIKSEDIEKIKSFLNCTKIEVLPLEKGNVFDLIVEQYTKEHCSIVRITDFHTNIVYLEKDGEEISSDLPKAEAEKYLLQDTEMDMESIWEFVNTVKIEKVEKIIKPQMEYNLTIAEEGMKKNYGANIGKVLKNLYGDDVKNRACYMAAAASDARMNGCELPVVINSGSGNQGVTVTLPILVYAKELNLEGEKVIRALLLANMIALYEKKGIGRLSAYCGAISAGAAAVAGIAYLYDEDYETIVHTVVNTLAISSGVICDGAKASCAGKIALAIYTGLMGYEMYKNGQEFVDGDGIIVKGIDGVFRNIGELATEGMNETNKTIIKMMTRTKC